MTILAAHRSRRLRDRITTIKSALLFTNKTWIHRALDVSLFRLFNFEINKSEL